MSTLYNKNVIVCPKRNEDRSSNGTIVTAESIYELEMTSMNP